MSISAESLDAALRTAGLSCYARIACRIVLDCGENVSLAEAVRAIRDAGVPAPLVSHATSVLLTLETVRLRVGYDAVCLSFGPIKNSLCFL